MPNIPLPELIGGIVVVVIAFGAFARWRSGKNTQVKERKRTFGKPS
jgi:hypothetical protein